MSSRTEGSSQAAATLLREVPIDGIAHYDRELREHLIGCHALLERWGAAPEVQIAGLFHSVYGTATFKTRALEVDERPRVRALIGEGSERLVYLFGFGDRRRLLLENHAPPHTWTAHAGQTSDASEAIDDETLAALVLIEAANFLEQLPHVDAIESSTVQDMRRRFAAQRRHIPAPIWQEIEATLGAALEVRRARGAR